MKHPQITKQFIERELYKLCAGYDTSIIIGKYSLKSTWQPTDIIKRLLQACLERTSLEDICSTTEGPSAVTIHRRCSELQFEQAEQLVNGWLIEVVSRLKFHSNTKITLAFDLYDQPFYGNSSYDWITGTKRKKGTYYAISFLVVIIATQNIRCPVAVRLMTKERRKDKSAMVSQILDELFVWLQLGNRHFRHRQGHKPCLLSSLTGRRRTGKWPWQLFIKVRQTLTEFLESIPSVVKVSPLQWETIGTRLTLLPFYTPERYLIQLHERVQTKDLRLLLLVPKIITAKDFLNIDRYGKYRLKVRAVYSYAYLYSIPRRLILTTGQAFYHLTNRRQVWSRRYERYCRTLFDYELREVGLNILL